MRVVQFQLLSLLALVGFVLANEHPLRQVQDKTSLQKRLFGVCIFGWSWLGDCQPAYSSTSSPVYESTSSGESPTPTPTDDSNGGVSATPTPTPNATTTYQVPTPTLYSYVQPTVPRKTVSAPASLFTARDAGYISSFTRTRYYYFDLGYAAGAPDGFLRRMTVINGQYPAPLIEANQGDELVIRVYNGLDHPQSIHWHGIRQNYTNHADGVPGVSQCPIQPGSSYTYRFKLESEMGTYWYHSHYGNTLADGVTGGIVVHSRKDPLKQGRDYDDERVMYVADWQDDQSMTILDGLLNATKGYRGSPIPPDPDAILINGVGQTNCSRVQPGVKCTQTKPHVIKAWRGDSVRFRIINTGAHAMIRLSIDKHILKVVELDDTPIEPLYLHEVPVNAGQRVSIVVKMDQGSSGASFWIRASMAAYCINPKWLITQKAILQYNGGWSWNDNTPTTQPWDDLADPATAECVDLDELMTVTPLVREDPPRHADEVGVMNSAFGQFVDASGTPYIGFGYNHVPFVNYVNDPLLRQIEEGRELNGGHVASITFHKSGSADLIVNQLDPAPLSHPFHLHGRPFYLMARGRGSISERDIPTIALNYTNPLRRDTITLSDNSWAILRVITDTPGVWPLHCHIGWHLAVGKLAVMVVRPDAIRKFAQPRDWQALCNGLDVNQIGPGRRGLDPAPAPPVEEVAPPEDEAVVPPTGRASRHFRKNRARAHGSYAARGLAPLVETRQFMHNDTDWWVPGTVYHGKMDTGVPGLAKRDGDADVVVAREFHMNATDWWVPGTIYHGKVADGGAPAS